MIPYGRQNISEADIEAVVKVLRSDFITQGPWFPDLSRNGRLLWSETSSGLE